MSASARVTPIENGSRGAFRLAVSAVASRARSVLPAAAAAWSVASNPLLVRIAVSAALVSGFVAAIGLAERHLASMDQFKVDPRCLKIREMPAWLSPDWADTIGDPLHEGGKGNLFEPGLTAGVYDAYRKSPWIEEITSVRKQFPNRLSVMLKIRTPLAAVPWDGKLLLVDGHGVLLPVSFEKVPDFGFRMRVIEGVTAAPPKPGTRWKSAALDAGLSVATVLMASGRSSFDRITRIDVSILDRGEGSGRTDILLRAAEGGGPIEWGLKPGSARADLEIPVQQKLDNLDSLLRSCPDMNAARYALVQFDEPRYAPAAPRRP